MRLVTRRNPRKFYDQIRSEDLDLLFTTSKNLGIYDLNPLLDAKQEPWYKEDATNGGGTPFDKSLVNATGNPISSNSSSKTVENTLTIC